MSKQVTIDTIGSHLFTEAVAKRQVPKVVKLAPLPFWRIQKAMNAKIFVEDGVEHFEIVTAAGQHKVMVDAAMDGESVVYE